MNYSYKVNPIYKAWKEFDYAVYDMIKRFHYNDRQDAMQQSYIIFEYLYNRYNPSKGKSFKSWVIQYLKRHLSRYCYENGKIYHRPIWTFRDNIEMPIKDVVSIDSFYTDNDNDKDAIDDSIDIEKNIFNKQLKQAVKMLLDSIPEKYSYVIQERIGLVNPPRTLQDIAKELNCSPEYVRQIYIRGMEYLKARVKDDKYKGIGDLLNYEA